MQVLLSCAVTILLILGVMPTTSWAQQSFTLAVPVRPGAVPQTARVKIAFESSELNPIGSSPQIRLDGSSTSITMPATNCVTNPATCSAVGVFGSGVVKDVMNVRWVSPTRMELTLLFKSEFTSSNYCSSTRTADRSVSLSLTGINATGYRMAGYTVPALDTVANPAPKCDVPFRRVKNGGPYITPPAGVNNLGRLPLDVILVLDKSGSMGWNFPGGGPTEVRWDRLTQSVGQFVGLWQVATSPGVEGSQDDRMGLVFFDSTATDGVLEPPSSIFKKRGTSSNSWDVVTTQVGANSPGGSTSIGAGIQLAKTRWDALAMTEPNDLTIVVFTDGEQNTAPLVAPDSGLTAPLKLSGTRLMDYSTPILTIGLGAGSGPFADLLDQIANETSGRAKLTTGGLALDTMFADHLVEALKGNTLSLQERQLSTLAPSASQSTPLNAMIDGAVKRAIFVLGWTGAIREGIELEIRRPDGTVVEPTVQQFGPFWQLAAVDIPADGPAGLWQARVVRVPLEFASSSSLPFHLSAYAVEGRLDYRFTETPQIGTGKPVTVRGELSWDNHPLTGLPSKAIRVTVERPTENLGNILHDADAKGDAVNVGGDAQSPITAKIDALNKNGALTSRIEPRPLPNVLSMAEVGNGIYEVSFDQTVVGGQYRFRIDMDWTDPKTGQIKRTETLERQLPVLASAQDSLVTVTRDKDTATILVTPKDRFGNFVGPGYSQFFNLQVAGGGAAKLPPDDPNLKGTYVVKVTGIPAGVDPQVKIGFRDLPLREGTLSTLGSPTGPCQCFDIGCHFKKTFGF